MQPATVYHQLCLYLGIVECVFESLQRRNPDPEPGYYFAADERRGRLPCAGIAVVQHSGLCWGLSGFWSGNAPAGAETIEARRNVECPTQAGETL